MKDNDNKSDNDLVKLPGVPEKIDMKQNQFFPTQIFSFYLEKQIANVANKILLEKIYSERQRDHKGIQRSNFKALGGWHSHNNLHKDASYQKLVQLISACCISLSEQNGYDRSRRLEINTMWSIINPPGSSNRAHIHPASIWSGVYYVQAPKNAGNIEFTDPRTQHLMTPPRYIPNKKRPAACWTSVNFTPEPGLLLIFPSWLYHSVAPNLSEEKGAEGERVIVSFNMTQVDTATNKN